MDRRQAKRQLKKIIDILEDNETPFTNVIVFGSFARDMATDRSDLDICVVFPDTVKDIDPHLAKLSFAAGKLNLMVDITGTHNKSLKSNMVSPFLNEVRKYGIDARQFLGS